MSKRNYRAKPARGTSVRNLPISGGSNRTPSGLTGNWLRPGRKDVILPYGTGAGGGGAGGSGGSFVTKNGAGVHSDGSVTPITVNTACLAANPAIIAIVSDGAAYATAITDAASQTWTHLGQIGSGGALTTEMWFCPNNTGLGAATTVTVAIAGNHVACILATFDGLSSSVPASAYYATATHAGDTHTYAAPSNDAIAGDIVVACAGLTADAIGTHITPGTGYTKIDVQESDFFLFIQTIFLQYKVVVTGGAQTPSSTDDLASSPTVQTVTAILPQAVSAGGGSLAGGPWLRGGEAA